MLFLTCQLQHLASSNGTICTATTTTTPYSSAWKAGFHFSHEALVLTLHVSLSRRAGGRWGNLPVAYHLPALLPIVRGRGRKVVVMLLLLLLLGWVVRLWRGGAG